MRMFGRSLAALALSFFHTVIQQGLMDVPRSSCLAPPHVAAMFLPEKGQRPACLRGACDSALKTNRCFSRGSASLLPPEHICRLQAFISCWYFISSLCMACKCTSLTHNMLATAEVSADFFGKSRGSGKVEYCIHRSL